MMAQKPEGAEATQKQGKPAQQGDIPANMKTIGPLSVGQRAKYMSHQMIQGVKQWFSANWPKLLAGAIAALAAFVGLNILTGGAITAALPALMQVFGAVMGGVALANIAGYVGNYLSQGWAGNIGGAAKSLARGLATGAVELVFALLFNAGAVIKAVKGGLKGTAKAAKGAVKNTVKTTVKSVKELGEIGAKGAKTAIKNGKIMLQGVKGGFAKGAKSLDDLAKRLWGLRFKKFSISRSGKLIQLWGHINPKIRLAAVEFDSDSPADVRKLEGHLEAIKKSGEPMDDALRQQLTQLAEDFGQQIKSGEVTEAMKKRLMDALQQFEPQHVNSNPVLKEVWERTLQRLAKNSNRWRGKINLDGTLTPQILGNAQKMKELYADARGAMNREIQTVMEEINKAMGPMQNQVTSLPTSVQLHHLLYKAHFPNFAVTPENLILALRKVGGASDELHDLLHYISAGAGQVTGKNRFTTLLYDMVKIIKEVYGL
jgi:hypothetical protein